MLFNLLEDSYVYTNTSVGNKSLTFSQIDSVISGTTNITLSGTDILCIDCDLGSSVGTSKIYYNFTSTYPSSTVISGIHLYHKQEESESYTEVPFVYDSLYTYTPASLFTPRFIRLKHDLTSPSVSGTLVGFNVVNDETVVDFGSDGLTNNVNVSKQLESEDVVTSIDVFNSGSNVATASVHLDLTGNEIIDEMVSISETENGPWINSNDDTSIVCGDGYWGYGNHGFSTTTSTDPSILKVNSQFNKYGVVLDILDDTNDYEKNHVMPGTILNDSGTYKMWYSGYSTESPAKWRTFLAVYSSSTNTWVRQGSVSISFGVAPYADTNGILNPCVIKDGSTYKMWYSGYDGTYWKIMYATSPTGLNGSWTKYTSPGVVVTSGTTVYDTIHTYQPSVIKDGSTYKMWYQGSDGINGRILYATSLNGTTWSGNTMVLNVSSLDGTLNVGTPHVIKDNGVYKMWYYGASTTVDNKLYYATSIDGVSWTKHGLSLSVGNPGDYDDYFLAYPYVLKEDDIYKMWYAGNDGTNYRVMYAERSDVGVYTSRVFSQGGEIRRPLTYIDFDNTTYSGIRIAASTSDAVDTFEIRNGKHPPLDYSIYRTLTVSGNNLYCYDYWKASGTIKTQHSYVFDTGTSVVVYNYAIDFGTDGSCTMLVAYRTTTANYVLKAFRVNSDVTTVSSYTLLTKSSSFTFSPFIFFQDVSGGFWCLFHTDYGVAGQYLTAAGYYFVHFNSTPSSTYKEYNSTQMMLIDFSCLPTTVSGNTAVWYTRTDTNDVVKMNHVGTVMTNINNDERVTGITSTPDGGCWYVCENNIINLDSYGTVLGSISYSSDTPLVTIDYYNSETLWAGFSDRVDKIDTTTGEVITSQPITDVSYIYSASDGVWVRTFGNYLSFIPDSGKSISISVSLSYRKLAGLLSFSYDTLSSLSYLIPTSIDSYWSSLSWSKMGLNNGVFRLSEDLYHQIRFTLRENNYIQSPTVTSVKVQDGIRIDGINPGQSKPFYVKIHTDSSHVGMHYQPFNFIVYWDIPV